MMLDSHLHMLGGQVIKKSNCKRCVFNQLYYRRRNNSVLNRPRSII